MHYLLIFSFTITNTYYFGVNKVNIVCYCFIECDFETCMRIIQSKKVKYKKLLCQITI